jgi:hypothetical protein
MWLGVENPRFMLVTVIVPTHNRRHLLREAIDSALTQQGVDVEVVVVDDRSTDGTAQWLDREYAGKPVRVLANDGPRGPASARNTGLAAARGELVALLDSDDRFLPGHLAAARDAFERHPEVDVLFGSAVYERNGISDDYMGPNFARKLATAPVALAEPSLRVFKPEFLDHLLAHGCWFNLSSVVLRRTAASMRMDEDLRVAEDYLFWVRLSQQHRFGCLTEPQIRYLLHDTNISFEMDSSVCQHSPALLLAYARMRALPGLSLRQRRIVDHKVAEELFNWAWRCRKAGQWLEALKLHLRSMRHGMRARNAAAVCKVTASTLTGRTGDSSDSPGLR